MITNHAPSSHPSHKTWVEKHYTAATERTPRQQHPLAKVLPHTQGRMQDKAKHKRALGLILLFIKSSKCQLRAEIKSTLTREDFIHFPRKKDASINQRNRPTVFPPWNLSWECGDIPMRFPTSMPCHACLHLLNSTPPHPVCQNVWLPNCKRRADIPEHKTCSSVYTDIATLGENRGNILWVVSNGHPMEKGNCMFALQDFVSLHNFPRCRCMVVYTPLHNSKSTDRKCAPGRSFWCTNW